MPRYFFDIIHGEHLTVDEDGSDLPGYEQARAEAIELLPLIAREELPDGEHRVFRTTLRDENGKAIYRATLTFLGEQLS